MATAKDKPTEEPRPLDEAPQPGGVYVVGDRVVDSLGQPLEGWSVDSNGNATRGALAPPPPAATNEGNP